MLHLKIQLYFILNMLEKYALVLAMKTVLAAPNTPFSVRGLAKEAKLSPGASGTALNCMLAKGMVSLKTIGKTHQYQANLESALCRQWKILFNLDKITDSKIVEEIVKRIPTIQSVLLYGSFAKGTNDEKSDIDLLVIVHHPTKTDLGFANRLKKEANLSVLSLTEWRRKAVQNKVFYENVILDCIALFGEKPVVV